MRGASLRASLSIDWFELRISRARFAQDAKLAKKRYFGAWRSTSDDPVLIRPLRSLRLCESQIFPIRTMRLTLSVSDSVKPVVR